MNSQHYPVMHKEITEIFGETGQKCFVDCTLGMGGHSSRLLDTYKTARIIGIDVDAESLEKARANLADFAGRVDFYNINYTEIFEKLDLTSAEISGILVDPGLSIAQIKDPSRGFSHTVDAPLDMRKDTRTPLTAHHVVNTYSEKELIHVFEKYGEVRKANLLAKRIIEYRLFNPIDSTKKLSGIIEKLYGWRPKKGKTHPAAPVFQALRILVNRELEGVEEFIKKIPEVLNTGARIVFLTFHSVEDRMVKHVFTDLRRQGKLKIIKPFPAFPSESEVEENLPSRSVKLRAAEVL
jgi:16S rRNA (cytosine1402-N4)-methyltransferase